MLSLKYKRFILPGIFISAFQCIALVSAQVLPQSQALESSYVSTAERKMREVQRETDSNAVNAAPSFLSLVAANYPGSPVMYGAMNLAGGRMTGLGPPNQTLSPTLHHVTSADSFFKFNISPTWKQKVASDLGVPVDDRKVFDHWCDTVNNGQNIPSSMLNLSSTGAPANEWWSPDARMERPSSNSRSQGDNDFFAMCQIVSLAPEWYPKGLVRINASTSKYSWIRPVSFDGMTSPLWVQRPPDQPARTGGNAIEILNKTSVPLSGLKPSQAYVISKDLSNALKNSPSVNKYSPDLNQVRPGSTPESQRMAKQQIIIVEEAREARRLANEAFRKYFTNHPLDPVMRLPHSTLQKKIPFTKLTESPETLSIEQLKNEMRFWAQHKKTEHRGQRFQAERYQRLVSKSEDSAKAIEVAATDLLRQEINPDVLNIVIHLGSIESWEFHQALLISLENNKTPIPESPGIRFNTVQEEFLWTLSGAKLQGHDELILNIDEFFASKDRHDLRLALLSHIPESKKMPSIAKALLKGKPDIHQVCLTAKFIGKHHPNDILELAAPVAELPLPTRKAFMTEIKKAASDDWLQKNSILLKKALNID